MVTGLQTVYNVLDLLITGIGGVICLTCFDLSFHCWRHILWYISDVLRVRC
jgi:hypothetical protein